MQNNAQVLLVTMSAKDRGCSRGRSVLLGYLLDSNVCELDGSTGQRCSEQEKGGGSDGTVGREAQ